jgi:hypothetical protein
MPQLCIQPKHQSNDMNKRNPRDVNFHILEPLSNNIPNASYNRESENQSERSKETEADVDGRQHLCWPRGTKLINLENRQSRNFDKHDGDCKEGICAGGCE